MRLTPDSAERHYRLRWTRPVNQLLSAVWTIIWLAWVLASAKPDWSVMIPVGVCLAVITAWANILAIIAGVYEDENGIVVRSLFRCARYEWNQLCIFDHARRGTHDYVYAKLADGSHRRLTNVLQGQPVVWEGGSTDDIVAVLSERLKERRGTHTSLGA